MRDVPSATSIRPDRFPLALPRRKWLGRIVQHAVYVPHISHVRGTAMLQPNDRKMLWIVACVIGVVLLAYYCATSLCPRIASTNPIIPPAK